MTLSFGIVGCGVVADSHAEAILALDGAKLHSAASHTPARAEAFAAKYGIRACTYEEMLADSEVDAVCICTPNGCHAQQAIAALEAGKHVVLEKPMAITTAEAEQICQAVEKTGQFLTVICQMRFSEDVRRLKELVDTRALGKLIFCELSMKYWREPAYYSESNWKGTRSMDGGGALMNQGIHGIDLLLHIVGDARLLSGNARTNFHTIEVEDTAAALLEFENGALGTVIGSTCTAPGYDQLITLTGTNGYAVLRDGCLTELVIDGKTLVHDTPPSSGIPEFLRHNSQIQNFIQAVYGKEPLLIDAREGLRAVRLIEQIYQCDIL